MKKGPLITIGILLFVISYVVAVNINRNSPVCQSEYYGYLYNSNDNTCYLSQGTGCTNPFKYKTEESCITDNLYKKSKDIKINLDPPKIIIRTVTNATFQRYILVKNNNPFPVNVNISLTGDFYDSIELLENNYILEPKEEIKSNFKLNTTDPGEYKTNIIFTFSYRNKTVSEDTEVLTTIDLYNFSTTAKKMTYGSCVSDLTKQKQICYKTSMNNYRFCNQNLNNTSKINYKEDKELCKSEYKLSLSNCTIDFKESKLLCIRYRCKENEIFYQNKCIKNYSEISQGVIGNISITPRTPVCKLNESCSGPYKGNFEIIGRKRYSSYTNNDGSFKVDLIPGEYTLLIKNLMNECKTDFNVQENNYTNINLDCDLGIR